MSPEAGPGRCPRCGAVADPSQEYCLECGARLVGPGGPAARLGAAWKGRFRRYPGDWIWPALGLLAIAALGALLATVYTRGDAAADASTVVATGPVLSAVSATTGEATLPTVAAPAPAALPPVRRRGRTVRVDARNAPGLWPLGRSGYTVVLVSIPGPSGRSVAVADARRAQASGLKGVGVLDSDRYSSLHPGYLVVFNGVYGSYSQAAGRLDAARAAGFAAAHVQRVTT